MEGCSERRRLAWVEVLLVAPLVASSIIYPLPVAVQYVYKYSETSRIYAWLSDPIENNRKGDKRDFS